MLWIQKDFNMLRDLKTDTFKRVVTYTALLICWHYQVGLGLGLV